jgi:hypothetical protein
MITNPGTHALALRPRSSHEQIQWTQLPKQTALPGSAVLFSGNGPTVPVTPKAKKPEGYSLLLQHGPYWGNGKIIHKNTRYECACLQ